MKLRLLSLMFLFSLSWMSSSGFCLTKVPLMIIQQHGLGIPPELSTAEVYQAYWEAKRSLRTFGYDLKLRRYKHYTDQILQYGYSYSDYSYSLSAWRLRLARERVTRKNWVYFIVAPPAQGDGRWWFGGVAKDTCSAAPRVAYGTMGPHNTDGISRILHSNTIMAHEIGHLLGSSHISFLEDGVTPFPNMMHSAALHLITDSMLPWAVGSMQQIWSCQAFKNIVPDVKPIGSSSEDCLILGD